MSKKLMIAAAILLGLFVLEASSGGVPMQVGLKSVLPSVETAAEMAVDLGGPRMDKPVIVVMTEWCPYCRNLEKFLQQQNIPYVRADVEKDKKAADYFIKYAGGIGKGVPRTLVGPYLVGGYSPKLILKAYEKLGESPKPSGNAVGVAA